MIERQRQCYFALLDPHPLRGSSALAVRKPQRRRGQQSEEHNGYRPAPGITLSIADAGHLLQVRSIYTCLLGQFAMSRRLEVGVLFQTNKPARQCPKAPKGMLV